MARTKLEQITDVDEKMRQLGNHKKKLLQEHKTQERKDRTKRLIERGAILESIMDGPETLTNEQVKQFLEKTLTTEYSLKILNGLKEGKSEVLADKSAGLAQSSDRPDMVETAESLRNGGASDVAKMPETARRPA